MYQMYHMMLHQNLKINYREMI